MKRQNYKKLKITLITGLLFILTIGFGIIYLFNSKEKQPIFDNSKVTHKIDNSDITTLLNKITSSYGTCNTGYALDFKEKNVLLANELDENFKYNIIYNILKRNNKIIKQYKTKNEQTIDEPASFFDETKYTEILTMSDISDVYSSLFGYKPEETLSSFKLGNKIYSSNGSSYSANIDEAEEEDCSYSTKYSIYFATSSKEEITLEYILYFETDNKAYTDANFKNKVCGSSKVNDYKDDFIKYRFTFKGNNNNYVLKSVSLV